jgi:FkbM family methyltransferase
MLMRKALRSLGYDLHILPLTGLTLRDLQFDLPRLMRSRQPVVFDVGANKGQTINLMQRTLSKPRITAFEPNPDLVSFLQQNYASPTVRIENTALGSVAGNIEFCILENDELSSVLELDRMGSHPFINTPVRKRVTVPSTTLDSYAELHKVESIDLLKVDTQGYDLEVLRGAATLLTNKKVTLLLVEVNFVRLYEKQCSFAEIEEFLSARGYRLLCLYEVARNKRCLDWATACFCLG